MARTTVKSQSRRRVGAKTVKSDDIELDRVYGKTDQLWGRLMKARKQTDRAWAKISAWQPSA